MILKKKKIYSVPSIFGGYDCFDADTGQRLGSSIPSITGNGENYYGIDGSTGYSIDSMFGGRDLYGSDGQRAYTVPSMFGGEDICGDIEGFSLDNPLGGEDIVIDDL